MRACVPLHFAAPPWRPPETMPRAQVVGGCLREQDKVTTVLLDGAEAFQVQEVGVLAPKPLRTRYSDEVKELATSCCCRCFAHSRLFLWWWW